MNLVGFHFWTEMEPGFAPGDPDQVIICINPPDMPFRYPLSDLSEASEFAPSWLLERQESTYEIDPDTYPVLSMANDENHIQQTLIGMGLIYLP